MFKWLTAGIAAFSLLFATPALAQTPPGVLLVGQIAEPKSLDPQASTATNDFRILVNMYDGLVRFKKGTLEVEPSLATDWSISDDGLTYTFELREDVTFHDGTPFDAEAVKFTFERMLKEDHPFHDTGPFPLAFFFSAIDTITATDPTTVEFRLKEPFAPFLSNLAYPTGLIVSPTAVETFGKEFGRNPVGTGAFEFEEWAANQRVVATGFAEHWDGAPALEAVVFRPVTDANTRVAEMLSGGLDMMVEVPADSLQTFRDDATFEVFEEAGPHLWFLILNTREGPFADKRVRQAVNYAIDKQAIAENVLQGTADVAAGPIPPAFTWANDGSVEPYPHDPEKARALIEEAGASGQTVTFYVAEGGSGMLDPVAMAAAIQADLEKVGLTARIETYEWNTFLSNVNQGLEGKADMAEMAWMTNDPDTLPFLALRSDAVPSEGGFNSGYYANPEVDALLDKARRTTDQAERATYYNQIQRIVHEDAPWAFIANWKQNAVARSQVQNFSLEPSFLLILKDVSKG
ncbi:ABC transporter substrate-binding protein [Fulvimarina sp. 2208YS6-2-32]|uniref:ABC transporter substrate-binding protein n=1 Tax=Fulvimarina uroteuthidis TaxID=3098149 RepID=A0ABU5I5A3_9HYPH|nr:ABC transporter substrate-binding protein [Fulvimarina sp. 2208YS6-2-32]MDY8110557.1 ABC transporter substrate-binding protein [Fulvimarina sp. 2208YS6-2-32]